MKKRILALSLITVVTGGFLTSCNSGVNYEEGVIIKIGDKAYTIDDVYRELYGYKMNDDDTDYTITESGAKAYYTLLNNLLIQLAVPTTTSITKVVDNKMKSDYYELAKTNASTNGTSESEEREKILETNNVDDEAGLRAKFLLERKTSNNSNSFYSDSNYKAMTPEYVKTQAPYHVRHVLVKVTAAGTDITNATISEENAKHLYNVISRLVSSESFGQVALTTSDDGSAAEYGDLGIMDLSTSFVSEFKYGIYGYDSYFNSNSNKSLAKERLSIPATADSVIGTSNFGIPLSEVLKLNQYADITKSDDRYPVEDASEKNYPRNIIFSQYLNNHGSSYIYLDKEVSYYKTEFGVTVDSSKFQTISGLSDSLKQISYDVTNKKNIFTPVSGSQKVLCDEKARPILVTRSGSGTGEDGYQGVFFISVERSPFVDMGDEGKNINDYYTLDIPSVSADHDEEKQTYINFLKTDDRSVYTARANKLRDEHLKTFDSNMDYRIYESNKASATGITIDPKVDALVERYISTSRSTTKADKELTYHTSWDTYLDLLNLQQSLVSRVLPANCIDEFKNGTIDKGGVCYVNY